MENQELLKEYSKLFSKFVDKEEEAKNVKSEALCLALKKEAKKIKKKMEEMKSGSQISEEAFSEAEEECLKKKEIYNRSRLLDFFNVGSYGELRRLMLEKGKETEELDDFLSYYEKEEEKNEGQHL